MEVNFYFIGTSVLIIILTCLVFQMIKCKNYKLDHSTNELEKIVNTYLSERKKFIIIFVRVENIYEILSLFQNEKIQNILMSICNHFRKTTALKYIYKSDYAFLLFIPNTRDLAVKDVTQRIFSYLRKTPLKIEGISVYLNVSIGWASSCDGDYENIVENGYRRIKPFGIREEERYLFGQLRFDLTKLISEFKNSLNRNEFYLVYQPKLNLNQNSVLSAEALIRWKHKVYGEIPPLDFIPHLEKTNFINDLTNWVLNAAILDMKDWSRRNINLKISINICPRNILDEEFVKRMDLIIKINMPFSRNIQLEITETDLMTNINNAQKILEKMKKDEIEIHIDDFGTGYSSLAYLKKLPIDCIKIDRSFIKDLDREKINNEIVKTTIKLAHALNKKVVAEGVETKEILDILKEMKCNEIQGYYFSKPLSKMELEKFISKKNGIV